MLPAHLAGVWGLSANPTQMVFALSYEADFPEFHFNLQSLCPLEMGLQTAANAEATRLENKNSRKRRRRSGAEENQ